jgi:hypothetical protein
MNEASPFSDPVDPVNDPNFPPKALPGSLNALTILTFIGCALGLIFQLFGFVGAQKQYDQTEELLNSGKLDDAPGFMKGMINADSLEILRKTADNRLPLLIIGLVGLGLCFYGALQMRKLSKQGFYIWLMGEIIPSIGAVIFVGAGMFAGFGLLGIAIPVIFIILYATQLKYLR